MGNASLEKFPALRFESEAPVKRHRQDLSVKHHPFMARIARHVQQYPQQSATDTSLPPCGQYRHPADMPVRK